MKLRRSLKHLHAYIGRRRKSTLAAMTLVLFILLTIYNVTWLSWSFEDNLSHFRRSRSLEHYFKNIKVLIEPSDPCCKDSPMVMVLVASSAARRKNRDAIRKTWGKHFYTYFVMGVDGNIEQDHKTAMKDLVSESKYFKDIVLYDFREHYQNLTLKTALMMKWTVDRCPWINFFVKVDDDVLVNPWTLKKVLKRDDFELIGYVTKNAAVYRNEGSKWFLPRWLYPEDMIPQFLSGPLYVVRGAQLDVILNAAFDEPLHNLEDVYFSYNVATKRLGLNLTHDHRLSPFRPWPMWLPLPCAYWNLASVHSVTPYEMRHLWSYIEKTKKKIDLYPYDDSICHFYDTHLQSFVLWVMEYRRYTSQ